jgi:hypothetical protein
MVFHRAASGWTSVAKPSPLPCPRCPMSLVRRETAVLRFTSADALMRDAMTRQIASA